MRKLIILYQFLFLINCIQAQEFTCELLTSSSQNNSNQVQSQNSLCSQIWNYTIYPNFNHTPIKTLRVSFDIIQRSDGSGNFDGSTDEQITQYCSKLIEVVNNYLSNMPAANPAVLSHYIVNSRIRIVLNKVSFYKNHATARFHRVVGIEIT